MITNVNYLIELENAVEKKICEIENEMQNIFSFLNANNKLNNSFLPVKKNSLVKKSTFHLNKYRKDNMRNNQRQKNLIIHSFLIKKKTQLKKEYSNRKRIIKEEKKINSSLTSIQNRISKCIYNIYDEKEVKVKSKKKKECNHSVKLIREIALKKNNCVLSLTQSKDMNYLLAGLDNGLLYIYDFSKENINNIYNTNTISYNNMNNNYNEDFLPIHGGAITSIQFSEINQKIFFTVGIDKKIKIWKISKNMCFSNNKEVSKRNLKCLCEMKFNYHITNCIFHSNIKDTLIIGFINGIIKIVKLIKNYEDNYTSNNVEIQKKENNSFRNFSKNSLLNSNKSFFNCFTENSFNNSHNNNFFNNSNPISCNEKQNIFRKLYNQNFFEANFLENMNNLKKKKRKNYELKVTKQIRTKFSICALAMPLHKNLLFVGMCNGIVNIYTNNYEFKKELICRSKKGIYSTGKQVSSIRFNENFNLIIVTTLDKRIRIFDKKKLFLIYKIKGHKNSSLLFESRVFMSTISSKKTDNRRGNAYKKGCNKNYGHYKQIDNIEKKEIYQNINSSTLAPYNNINELNNTKIKDLIGYKKSNNLKKVLKIISASDGGTIYIWNFSLSSLEKDNNMSEIQSQYTYSNNVTNFFCNNFIKRKKNRKKYLMHDKEINVKTNNFKELRNNYIKIKNNDQYEYMHNYALSNSYLNNKRNIEKKKKCIINGNNFFQKIKKNIFKKSPLFHSNKDESMNFENILKVHRCRNGKSYQHLPISKLMDKHKKKKKKIIRSLENLEYFISDESKRISATYISKEFFYIPNNSIEKKEYLLEKRGNNSKMNFIQKIKHTFEKKKKNKTNKYSLFKKSEHSFHGSISCCETSCSKNKSFQKINNDNGISNLQLQKHFLIITANNKCIKIFMCYEKN